MVRDKYLHPIVTPESVKDVILVLLNTESIAASTIAKHFGMSSRTLRRVLAAYDSSYRQILQDARIERSQRLLFETDMSVLEISRHLGFSDPGSFSRTFRNTIRSSPREYRIESRKIGEASSACDKYKSQRNSSTLEKLRV